MTSGALDVTDSNMSAPLLAMSINEWLFAAISAIAFTTVLGTVSGLILASAGAVTHDLLANALGAYATVYYLTTGNFNVLPIRIAATISGDISLDPNMASALAMVLVGLMAVITVAHQLLLRRSYHASR